MRLSPGSLVTNFIPWPHNPFALFPNSRDGIRTRRQLAASLGLWSRVNFTEGVIELGIGCGS